MNESYARRILLTGLLLAAFAALPGCATKKPGEPVQVTGVTDPADDDGAATDNNDPLEPVNRGIFKFNQVLDGVLLSPMAHIYRGVVPEFARTGVHNAIVNIDTPVIALNSLLQWDMDNLGTVLGRCVINSTAGIGGLFDVASRVGIKKAHEKDFGQTLGVWGVGSGFYLMLPIIGPSDARDTVGWAGDVAADPFTWVLNTNAAIAYESVRGIVKRTDLLPLTDRVYRDSLDPYASFRSIYLQHRHKVVRDYKGEDAAFENEK